jgi:hypothetical protein
MPTKEPKCPECEKLHKISPQSQMIGEFLEYLQSRGYIIAERWKEVLVPVHESTNELLAEYFDIDMNKVERERQALLDFIKEK